MPSAMEPEAVGAGDTPPVELPVDNTPPRPYVVFAQSVDIDIDFAEKRVHGRSDILIVPVADDDNPVTEVFIDARQCEIDVSQIRVSNCEVEASYQDPCDLAGTPENYRWSAPQWMIRKHRMEPLLHHRRKEVSAVNHDLKCCTPYNGSIRVKLPSVEEVLRKNRDSQKADQQALLLHPDGTVGGYRVSIPYQLKNVCDGLQFVGVDETDTRYPHVYTRHSIEPGTASAIFPCIDDPGSRNSWKVSITCPRTLGDAYHEPSTPQPQSSINGNRKRKLGEEEPRRRHISLTEEDKQLEMTVVCSGYLTGEVINKDDETKKTMTFEVERNKAAKHIGFAVGPFEHVDLWSEFRSEEDDVKLNRSVVKVHGYCLPGRADEVRNTCSTLVTAIDYLILTFGAYPFESYKVCFVDDMIEDTVPLCAFSLCSTRLLYPADMIDTEVEITRALVHSLACQWFGINIIPNTKADIWLVTGLAWFLTDHFMKALCGNNEFRFRMKTMSDKLVETDIRRPSLHDLGEVLYLGSFEVDFMNLKAPLVLFILDRRLSKSTSTTGISRIISRMVTKANTSAQATDDILGSDAFRRACEKTCNSRLEHFWNQWVLMSGCPRFVVHQRFNKKRLCVEMTISQKQDIAFIKPRQLDKDEFWRGVMEEDHAVILAEPQHSFTGPMTIRIHEADGTPYEHIVEIREDSAKSVKFEIPYNTKYKRLKRNRRQRERAVASNNARGDEEGQKTLYYLGDVMQQPDEMEEWDFRDWDEETEQKMDQESYEWIRMDADFEWICDMQTNLPAYMYASQLQQDRDVVAQQDSMLFLNRSFNKTGPHPLVSTILTRTLLDPRYYYGIRIMAAEELPRHAANEHVNWIGLRHLLRAFQHFFCHPGTYVPRPNDFSDKRQYLVQRAIPEAIARIRGEDGRCPKEARRFILEQLQNNDNRDNIYSDQQYICCLVKALATCQLVDEKKVKQQKTMSFSFGDGDEDEVMEEAADPEPEEFCKLAVEEIERYRRMDEYSPSYQNCFTTAALDAFCRLMKAKIIPTNHITFVQYLQDKTYDLVRIKACQCLVELGMLGRPSFMRFLFLLVSTDPSPFVRHHLFKALCHGLAGIAIGENEPEKQATELPAGDELIVEQNEDIMEERKRAKARKENLTAARAALKKETTDDENLQTAIWTAMNSPTISVAERINLLELCSILFEEDQSLLLSFKYPSYWTAERGEKGRHRCLVKFKRHYRTQPRKSYATQPLPPKPAEPKRTITLNLNRSMSISAKPATPSTTQAPPLPAASTPKPLDPIPTPKSATSTQKQTSTLKEKPAMPIVKLPKQPSTQEAKDKTVINKVKQPIITTASRGATPSGSQEKSKQEKSKPDKSKADGSHRDSISVQAPVRPTIEVPQAEPRAVTPKVNGNGNLAPAKLSRPLKRASTENDSPRPTKIVRLDTSNIPKKRLEKLAKRPKRRLLRTVKFTAWHKLRLRKERDGALQAGSIRATPKHHRPEDRPGKVGKSGLSSRRPSVAPSSPALRAVDSSQMRASPSGPSASQNTINTTPTSSTLSQHSSQPGSDGKPRKPLPAMRKPLPMGGSTSNPTPSRPQSQSQGYTSSGPASSPPPSKGAPTKFKIRLKPSASGSEKN